MSEEEEDFTTPRPWRFYKNRLGHNSVIVHEEYGDDDEMDRRVPVRMRVIAYSPEIDPQFGSPDEERIAEANLRLMVEAVNRDAEIQEALCRECGKVITRIGDRLWRDEEGKASCERLRGLFDFYKEHTPASSAAREGQHDED